MGGWQGRIARFARDDRGAVAVEFVLIAPLLISLVFGIISFGYFFGVAHGVQQLAAEAARASVQEFTDSARTARAIAVYQAAVGNYPLLRPEAISHAISATGGRSGAITVELTYDLDGSILDLANGLFGLNITTVRGSAYLAY